jgi:RNA dependent RNA polymerase
MSQNLTQILENCLTQRHTHPPLRSFWTAQAIWMMLLNFFASTLQATLVFLRSFMCLNELIAIFTAQVLGIVAMNWMIIADQSPLGILDPDCMTLATLHSDAVDYPKSGQPVSIKKIPKLKFPEKPDWNAPETIASASSRFYKSRTALGRLFRAIKLPAVQRRTRRSTNQPFVEDDEETLNELMSDILMKRISNPFLKCSPDMHPSYEPFALTTPYHFRNLLCFRRRKLSLGQ